MTSPRLLLLGCCVVGLWGSTWVVLRGAIAHRHLAPEGIAVGRFAIASLSFALVALWRRPPRLHAAEWRRVVLAGLLGTALYSLLSGWGQRTVDAGTAAVIIQSAPLWTALGAWLVLRQQVGLPVWLGMATAFAGLALIARGVAAGAGGGLGDLAMLFASSLAFAAYNVVMQPVAARIGGWWATAYAVWIGTLALLPWTPWALADLRLQPGPALGAWAWVGLLSTTAGYAAWTALAGAMPLARAAVFLYLVPVVALLLGWAVLGERPGPVGFAGVGLILAGVVLAQSRRRPAPPAAEVEAP